MIEVVLKDFILPWLVACGVSRGLGDVYKRQIAYYEKLGFECEGIYPNGEDRCTFLHLNNLTLEVWTMDQPANATGAINHFALDVTDIDKAFEEAEKLGLNFVEGSVQHIDTFHENGIRYFNVLGPNHETIEFCQVL